MNKLTTFGFLMLIAGCGADDGEDRRSSRSPLTDAPADGNPAADDSDSLIDCSVVPEADGTCDSANICGNDPDCTNPAADDSDSLIDCSVVPEADGTCDSANICGNDPDCADSGNAVTDPGMPDDGTVCALFIEESDGACSRPAGDPCIAQDPDCTNPAADDSDSLIDCSVVPEADGSCDSADICGNDPDCTDSGDAAPDPGMTDGDTVCALFIEESDGACGRPADDPCITQDPDCTNPAADDSDSLIDCSVVPEADGSCDAANICGNDPDCAQDGGFVACAEYLEEPNGDCERDPGDPCKFQDPDCSL